MRSRGVVGCGFAVLGAVITIGACSKDPAPTGQLMLAVSSDMSLPKDIDKVTIAVSLGGGRFSQDYDVGPNGLRIPATLGILASSSGAGDATIKVIGRKNGKARTVRTVVTQVPTDRVAALRIAIQWLCDGTARTNPDGSVESTCSTGQSCVAGTCVLDAVDGKTLPVYDPAAIFGGGAGGGDGSCFDTNGCLGGGPEAALDPAGCSVPLPQAADPARVNVGLKIPAGGDGICGPLGCFIPLDSDAESGWKVADKRIALAPGVCGVLGKGVKAQVVVSTACAAKLPSVPACGPWSSTGKGDGGVAVVADGSTPDATIADASLPGAPKGVTAAAVPVVTTVTTLAGSGTAAFADGTGGAASFDAPVALAVDAAGNVVVADSNNSRIRSITSLGVVTTLAGSSVSTPFADGTGAAATFLDPSGVAVSATANVYVADQGNNRVRAVTTPAGVVTTLAGSDPAAYVDDTGTAARFSGPRGVCVDSAGNVYVADTANHRIRKVTPAGVVTTLAGSGASAFLDGTGVAASFSSPAGVAVDPAGNLYVADTANNRVRKVTPAGVVTTLAGSSAPAFADATGTSARFNTPDGVAVDAIGNVYVADETNNRVRRITPSGAVTTLAGSAVAAFADGTGSTASFSAPAGVAVDSTGTVFVADRGNQRVRKLGSVGIGQLSVSWSAPSPAPASPITGYTATARAPDAKTATCTTTGATTCTIGGLTSGALYSVSVTATNAAGASAASDTADATPN